MAIEIQIPKLGLTMEEAALVCWKFASAQMIKKDEIVLVIETDKVTFEMPSPGDGLLHPVIPAGTRVVVGQIVGYLAADKDELEKLAAQHPAVETAAPKEVEEAAQATGTDTSGAAAPVEPQGRFKASPVARAMAKTHGMNLAGIRGTGPGGRIIRADILKALEKGVPVQAAPMQSPAAGELLSAAREIPITGIRKVIFKNMHLSLSTQAQLTLHTEASAEALIRIRQRISALEDKIPYNAIIVKIIAQALKQHPMVNAGVSGEVIKIWSQIHVGVAMDFGKGLIVPKVRYAETKTIREIAADLERLIEAAKANRLSLDDLTMGTFTLTNLGAWDIDNFTPIVNPPESAILGVGRILPKPVIKNGAVVAEQRMALSLTFDHRIIDGTPGASFLKTVKDMIEEPSLML
ncbi:MAG: hypothetical protein A2V65_12325 [Deltaproteobacteria bacterium RBG_13_49_15]|nr:MAG: hypothetical protein A2V65_12325 [Deltaproteobacteria bacterium RBG_13_49_15]